MKTTLFTSIVLLVVLVLLSGAAQAYAAPAGIIIVNSTLDKVTADPNVCRTSHTNHICTLRAAVQVANNLGVPTTILVPAGIFKLTLIGAGEDNAATGDLDLKGNVAIVGKGPTYTIIDGYKSDRVFQVLGTATATLKQLTIQNGNPGADDGGGIKVDQGGKLTVAASILKLNIAVNGGALYVAAGGTATVASTTVTTNKSSAGGIANQGMLTMLGGSVLYNSAGGIVNQGGTMTLTKVTVTRNKNGFGILNTGGTFSMTGGAVTWNPGGIYNQDTSAAATITGVAITNNTNTGVVNNSTGVSSQLAIFKSKIAANTIVGSCAGVANLGVSPVTTIISSTISANKATLTGAGLYVASGSLSLSASTINANSGDDGAGLLVMEGASATVWNDTFTGNLSGGNGGAINNAGSVLLYNATLVNNVAVAGNAIYADGIGATSLYNTILSSLKPALNCGSGGGTIASMGFNIDNGTSCALASAGDLSPANPKLGLLANNGGPTLTMMPLLGSPAINNGTTVGCPPTDQRGVKRPLGVTCDIGAVEKK